MNMQVTLDISDKFAAAINGLSEAIRLASGAVSAANAQFEKVEKPAADKAKGESKSKSEAKAESKSDAKPEAGPIFWADNSTGYFGKVDSEAEYLAKKEEAEGVYKTTEAVYKKKLAELKAKNEADAKAKKEADAKASDSKTAAGDEHPSVEDLVEVFSRYLPKDLSKEERAERAAFVKPLLQRFGAAKATELAPEHRALAMNLVERKMGGEDIDPTKANFDEVTDEDMI